jgi:hypothetical protein
VAAVPSLDCLPIHEMLSPPSDDSVRYSLEVLFVLGAINGKGHATELGKMMNTFHKLSLESMKMILWWSRSARILGIPTHTHCAQTPTNGGGTPTAV